MKKGFTLIELIMVIIVLALLALIAVPTVSSIIKNTREKTYDEQINRIENVSKTYMTNGKRTMYLPEKSDDGSTNSCYVSVKTLKKVGLLSSDDIKDPRKGKDDINGYVVVSNQSGKFKYEYTDNITGDISICYNDDVIDDDTKLKVLYDCSTNGGTCGGSSTITKRVTISEILKSAPENAEKNNYDFAGWSFDKTSHERIRNVSSGDIKDKTKIITLYALYRKDASVNFHYYDSTSNTVTSTSNTCYLYGDNDTCSFSMPTKVSSSSSKYGSPFVGLALESGSMKMVDNNNLKVGADYYAIYSKEIVDYYYKDNGYTKGKLYRNEYIDSNNQLNTIISDSASGTSNVSLSGANGPGGSTFVGISDSTNVSNVTSDINELAKSNSSSLYFVYRFNALFAPGKNVDSVEKSSETCDVIYNNTSCNVEVPGVTVTKGFTFVGFSNKFDGGDEVNTTKMKVSTNNQKYYAIATDQTIPSIDVFEASKITTNSITLHAVGSAASGIVKYEFSIDNGVTWVDNGGNKDYTFSGLKQGTTYNFMVRVTSGVSLTNTATLTATTKTISYPIFEETCNSGDKLSVKITYPSGCGSDFVCEYVNGSNNVKVTDSSVEVTLDGYGTLRAVVSDGTNSTSLDYDYYKKTAISDVIKQNTSNTNNDDYRYTGASVNNYVTFNNGLWRIIGIVDGKPKLIKADSIGTMPWSSSTNNWESSSLADYLNDEYYTGLSEEARNMISSSTWYLGGGSSSYTSMTSSDFYNSERNSSAVYSGNPASVKANIGLIYPSDYGYAADESCKTTALYSYDNSKCYSKDWLYNSKNEWLISPQSSSKANASRISGSNGYLYMAARVTNNYDVRPSLYLNSNVYITNGEGTSSNPYSLEVIEEKGCGNIANIPTSNLCTNPTYNGNEQQLTSVKSGYGYVLSNYTGINAGDYNITASLKSGYKWSDNTTGTKTLTCHINKSDNYYFDLYPTKFLITKAANYNLWTDASIEGTAVFNSANSNIAYTGVSSYSWITDNLNKGEYDIGVYGGSTYGETTISGTFTPSNNNYLDKTINVEVKNVEKPTFSEENNGEVVITYPSGCGNGLICSYQKNGEDNWTTVTSGNTSTVYFGTSGSVVAKITAENYSGEVTSSYTERRTEFYVSSSGSDGTGYGTINKPYVSVSKAYISADDSATIYLKDDVKENDSVTMNQSKDIVLTSFGNSCSTNYTLKRGYSNNYMFDVQKGSLKVKNIILDGNSLSSDYTGIFVENDASVNLSECSTMQNFVNTATSESSCIINKTCLGHAGVVTTDDGTTSSYPKLIISGATIKNNIMAQDAAVHIGVNSTLNMTSGTISNNTSTLDTGGIVIWGTGTLIASGNDTINITKNTGKTKTGGIGVYDNGKFTYSGNVTVSNNTGLDSHYGLGAINGNFWIQDGAVITNGDTGFSYVGDAKYKIVNSKVTSYGLTVSNGETKNKTSVTLGTYKGNDNQNWKIYLAFMYSGKEYYALKPCHASDLYLTIAYNSDGTVRLSNQIEVENETQRNDNDYWKFINDGSNNFYLQSFVSAVPDDVLDVTSNMCIDIKGGTDANNGVYVDGQVIQGYKCNETNAQKWSFIKVS